MSRDSLIEAMLSSGPQEAEQPKARKSPHDVLTVTLQEYLADYAGGCRFKPGDLVTPKASAMIPDHGDPFMVVEVFAEPIRLSRPATHMFNVAFAARLDMRVLHELDGSIVANVAESWMYEPWTPKIEPGTKAN